MTQYKLFLTDGTVQVEASNDDILNAAVGAIVKVTNPLGVVSWYIIVGDSRRTYTYWSEMGTPPPHILLLDILT